jgi:hypothetical protein
VKDHQIKSLYNTSKEKRWMEESKEKRKKSCEEKEGIGKTTLFKVTRNRYQFS